MGRLVVEGVCEICACAYGGSIQATRQAAGCMALQHVRESAKGWVRRGVWLGVGRGAPWGTVGHSQVRLLVLMVACGQDLGRLGLCRRMAGL